MILSRRAIAVTLLAFLALSGPAPAKDLPGTADHPLVGRYDGSSITGYVEKTYEEVRFLNGPITPQAKRATGRYMNGENSTGAAGRAWRIGYDGPPDRSALEVMQSFETSLAAKGFSEIYICQGVACADMGGATLYVALTDESALGKVPLHQIPDRQIYASFVLKRSEGDVYASIYATDFEGHAEILVDVVETAALETGRIEFVDAGKMASEIGASGRVALYGLLFDFDKATISEASKPTLDEIAKFMTSNPSFNLVVAGHTDAKGGFDYNLELSQRRAEAVVDVLVKTYGIPAARLRPFGAGMAAPIASNETEAGRSKNRRVELVRVLN